MAKRLNERSVLQIASEALPFAKTGGLADVLGALPPALARLGWDVTVVTPRYRGVTAGSLVERFPVTVGGFVADAGFSEAPLPDSARAILIDCPDLYDRDALYGVDNVDYTDNARRFAFLVRAALEFAARRAAAPSIVHAHDWQAGVAPVYLRTLYAGHPLLGGRSIGESGGKGRGAGALRSAVGRRCAEAAPGRDGLAHGRSERLRSDRRAQRGSAAPRGLVRRPRYRRRAVPGLVDGARG